MSIPLHKKPRKIPPFISDQRLFRLEATDRRAKAWIENEYTARRYLDAEEEKSAAERSPLEQRCWVQVADRDAVLTDRTVLRLCILADAGRGKSNLTRQVEYLRCVAPSHRNHLVAWLEFKDIPAVDFENIAKVDSAIHQAIARRVAAQGDSNRSAAECIAEARLLLERQLPRAEVTLVVDALDQLNRGDREPPLLRAQALAHWMQIHPQVRVVVSGRPSAVLEFWQPLFSNGDHDDSDWAFVQVDEFTREQTEQFLGPELWPMVQRLDAETLSIPRALDQVFQLEPEDAAQLKTRGELYWLCLDRLLTAAFVGQSEPITRSEAEWLLAFLAFECLKQSERAKLEGTAWTTFRNGLWRDRQDEIVDALGLSRHAKRREFEDSLAALANLNDFMNPGAIKDGCAISDRGVMTSLEWNNATTRELFAALWVVRYATDADRQWLAENLHHAKTPKDSPLYEFWRFVVELPGREFASALHVSAARDDAVWLAAMQALVNPPSKIRSTEMIYRAWPELLRLAGYPSASARDLDVYQATWKLAAEVHAAHGGPAPAGANAAKHVLWEFLSEFPRLVAAKRPVALSLMDDSRYIRCPPGNAAQVTYRMGSPEDENGHFSNETQHEVTLDVYRLRDFVVTNAEYELFDASHAREQYTKTDAQPVVNVSWYDGVVYAYWMGLGFRLPTEAEWECGCRAGNETAYWWGPKFDETKAERRPRFKDKPAQGAFPPANDWGLSYMPGNVRQWCVDWDRADHEHDVPFNPSGPDYGVHRVLRGGSWYFYELDLRSAFRGRGIPGDRDDVSGLRLART